MILLHCHVLIVFLYLCKLVFIITKDLSSAMEYFRNQLLSNKYVHTKIRVLQILDYRFEIIP